VSSIEGIAQVLCLRSSNNINRLDNSNSKYLSSSSNSNSNSKYLSSSSNSSKWCNRKSNSRYLLRRHNSNNSNSAYLLLRLFQLMHLSQRTYTNVKVHWCFNPHRTRAISIYPKNHSSNLPARLITSRIAPLHSSLSLIRHPIIIVLQLYSSSSKVILT